MAKKAKPPYELQKEADNKSKKKENKDYDADFWAKQIKSADKHEDDWRNAARIIINRYRNNNNISRDSELQGSKYNILFANTEVLQGVLYQRAPQPDIRPRHKKKDLVALAVSELIEKTLEYVMDTDDETSFNWVMNRCVQDRLLIGRGQARVRYTADMLELPAPVTPETPPGTPPATYNKVVSEGAPIDYVPWELFRYSPTKRWNKVWWVAFGEFLTKSDVEEQFPEIASRISMDWELEGDGTSAKQLTEAMTSEKDTEQLRTLCWTVWCKRTRRVYVYATGLPDELLAEKPDPLKLKGFFPCPEPLYGITTTDSLIPIPDYIQYEDQAIELDIITGRITILTAALRRRGIYDASFPELQRLAESDDNEFVPVQNYAALVEKGVENAIFEMPIEQISKVLLNLYKQRDDIINIIYAITGISDILRGNSVASESATAQNIKAQYATSRVGPKQTQIAEFCKRVLRLQAEVIAEHFSSETLEQATGLKFPTASEIQQAKQLAQQQGQQPPADLPSQEVVMAALRNNKLRDLLVDIETDSTITTHEAHAKQAISDFTTAMATMIQSLTPAVEGGIIPKTAGKELLASTARKFELGKDFEEALATAQPDPPAPDPAAAQQATEKAKLEGAMKMKEMELTSQGKQKELELMTQAKLKEAELNHQANMQNLKHGHEQQIKSMEIFGQGDVGQGQSGPDGQQQQVTPFMLMQGLLQGMSALSQNLMQIGTMLQGIAQQNQMLLDKIAQPIKVVRDNSGRIIGAEKISPTIQ